MAARARFGVDFFGIVARRFNRQSQRLRGVGDARRLRHQPCQPRLAGQQAKQIHQLITAVGLRTAISADVNNRYRGLAPRKCKALKRRYQHFGPRVFAEIKRLRARVVMCRKILEQRGQLPVDGGRRGNQSVISSPPQQCASLE